MNNYKKYQTLCRFFEEYKSEKSKHFLLCLFLREEFNCTTEEFAYIHKFIYKNLSKGRQTLFMGYVEYVNINYIEQFRPVMKALRVNLIYEKLERLENTFGYKFSEILNF